MAAPTIQNGVGTTSTSANPSVNLPSNIGVGDLLFIIWAQDGSNNTINDPPSGWIDDHETNSTAVKVGFAYRVADGTEGSTVTYPSSAQATCWYAFRIPAAEVDAASFFVAMFNESDAVENRGRYYQFSEGTSAAPDPPSLTLPYPATDILWVTAYGADNSLDNPSPYPSGYTGLHNEGGLAGAMLGVAYKTSSSNTENPGAFAMSGSEQWGALTIGLRARAEGGSGGFPELRTATARASAGTGTYTIRLPESRATGDRVIVQLVRAGTSGTDIAWPGDWTEILDNTSSIRVSVAYRDLDGSEADTFDVTSNAIQAGYILYLIPAGDFDPATAPEVATPAAFSASSAPDPPSLSPSWGAADTLWIIGYGNADGRNFNQVDFPSGWGIAQRFCRISSAGLYGFASAARVENTATMDPGTLLISDAGTPVNKNGQAWTIAVKQVASSGTNISVGLIDQTAACFNPTVTATANISVGLIDQTVVAHAPSVGANISVALIDQTAAAFAPTLSLVIYVGFIDQTAACFSPVVTEGNVQVIDVALISQTASPFSPTVTSVATISLGLISQPATCFAPDLVNREINLELIDQTAIAFEQFVAQDNDRFVQLPYLVNEAQTLGIQLDLSNTIDVGLITNTPSLFAPTVVLGDPQITPVFLDNSPTPFPPFVTLGDSGESYEFTDAWQDAVTITDPPIGVTTVTGVFEDFNDVGETQGPARRPVIVAQSSNAGSSTTVTVPDPLLGAGSDSPRFIYNVAFISYDKTTNQPAPTLTPPSTALPWALLGTYETNTVVISVYARYNGLILSDDQNNYAFTLSETKSWVVAVFAIDGYGPTQQAFRWELFEGEAANSNTTSTSHTTGTLPIPDVDEDSLILISSTYDNATATTWTASPAGSNATELFDSANSVVNVAMSVIAAQQGPGMAKGPYTASTGSNARQTLMTYALFEPSWGSDENGVGYAGWIKLVLTKTMALSFDTFGSTVEDTVLAIFRDDNGSPGDVMAFNDDTSLTPWRDNAGEFTWSSIPDGDWELEPSQQYPMWLNPGTYWIRAHPYDGEDWDGVGNILLNLTRWDVVYDGVFVDNIDDVVTITDPIVGFTTFRTDFANFTGDPRDPEVFTNFTFTEEADYTGWLKLVLTEPMHLAFDTYGSGMFDPVMFIFEGDDPPGVDAIEWDVNDDTGEDVADRDFRQAAIYNIAGDTSFLYPAGTYWIAILPVYGTEWMDPPEPDLDPPETTDVVFRIQRMNQPFVRGVGVRYPQVDPAYPPEGEGYQPPDTNLPSLPPYYPDPPGHYDIVISVGGVDITADVRISSATFTYQVNGSPGTCNFEVKDAAQSYDFTTGDEIWVDIDGERYWGGYLKQATKRYALPVLDTTEGTSGITRIWALAGVDYNVLFQKRIVFDADDPAGHINFSYPVETYDDTIINDLFDNYLDLSGDGITRDGVTRVDFVALDIPGVTSGRGTLLNGRSSAASAGYTWKQAMDVISRATGAIYYIDPHKVLHYVDVDTADSPWTLTDRPQSATHRGLQAFKILENGTNLINDMMVWGAATRPIVFARAEDDDSIAEHGRWQGGLFSTGLMREQSAELVAESYVEGTPQSKRGGKNDAISVTCRVFRPDFHIGEKVRTRIDIYGYADTIPIRRMTLTFPNPTQVIFDLVLSHEIDQPWSIFELPPYPNFGNGIPNFQLPDIRIPPIIDDCFDGVFVGTSGYVLDTFSRFHPDTSNHVTGNVNEDWGFGELVNWSGDTFIRNNHYSVDGAYGRIHAMNAHYVKVNENNGYYPGYKRQSTNIGLTGAELSLKTMLFSFRIDKTEKIIPADIAFTSVNRPAWTNTGLGVDLTNAYNSFEPVPDLSTRATLPAAVVNGPSFAQAVLAPTEAGTITGTVVRGSVGSASSPTSTSVWYGSDGGGFVPWPERYGGATSFSPGQVGSIDYPDNNAGLHHVSSRDIFAAFFTAIDDRADNNWFNKVYAEFVGSGSSKIIIDRHEGGSGAYSIITRAENQGTSQVNSPLAIALSTGVDYYVKWYRPNKRESYVKIWLAGGSEPDDWQASDITNGSTGGSTELARDPGRHFEVRASVFPMQSYDFSMGILVAGPNVRTCEPNRGPDTGQQPSPTDEEFDGETWHMPFAYVKGSTQVWVNRLRVRLGYEYEENPGAGTITFTPPIDPDDSVHVIFIAQGLPYA